MSRGASRALGPVGEAVRDAEGPKERIHAAALRLLARYGYAGVSLQMIADDVGLHKSSLFHHYRGKLELASEVCLAAMERVLAHVEPLAHDDPPRRESFLRVIDACLDHFAAEPDAARLLLSLLVAPEDSDLNLPVGRSDADHPVMRLFTILGGWLERARSRGVTRRLSIRQTVPNLMGIVLMQPAVALGTSALTGRDPFSPRQRAQRRADVHALLAGLFPPGI
jgi:AcrR family transcriptional regulator